jgi:hypothetical protein
MRYRAAPRREMCRIVPCCIAKADFIAPKHEGAVADRLRDQLRLLSIANRTSSADVRTPSFCRMIEEVLATVL